MTPAERLDDAAGSLSGANAKKGDAAKASSARGRDDEVVEAAERRRAATEHGELSDFFRQERRFLTIQSDCTHVMLVMMNIWGVASNMRCFCLILHLRRKSYAR